MNKQQFIELLNLYLDNELSEEDAERVHFEIRTNEEYARIYKQYCAIQNAVAQLGGSFGQSQSAKPSAWKQNVYAIGGMAAAFVLLGLAAQNLAPFISTDESSPSVATARNEGMGVALTVNAEADSAPAFQILSGKTDEIDTEREPLDVFAVTLEQPATFKVPVEVNYSGFDPVKSDAENVEKRESGFQFEKPKIPSTFEHESFDLLDRGMMIASPVQTRQEANAAADGSGSLKGAVATPKTLDVQKAAAAPTR